MFIFFHDLKIANSTYSLEFGNLEQHIYEDLASSVNETDGLYDEDDILEAISASTERRSTVNSETASAEKTFLVSLSSQMKPEKIVSSRVNSLSRLRG